MTLDPNTVAGLIIGGVIGFSFSLLSSLIAFGFQIYHNNQAKKWEMEKQQLEDGKKVISERIEVLDASIFELMTLIQAASNAIESLFSSHPDTEALRNFRPTYILPITQNQLKIMVNFFYFHDDELRDSILDLYKTLFQQVNIYDRFIEAVKAKDLEAIEELRKDVSEFDLAYSEKFQYMFARRDFIKTHPVEQLEKMKRFSAADTALWKMRHKREAEHSQTGIEKA